MVDAKDRGTCTCKIGRGIERYGLDTLDSELIHKRHEEEASLRDLAEFTNCRILAAALSEVGASVSGDIYGSVNEEEALAAIYRALNGNDTPAEREARVRTRLEQIGVDVDAVEDAWVTHPTVRSHLRKCLGVDTRRDSTITYKDTRDTIEWSRTRCSRIVEQAVGRLGSSDLLSTGPIDVTVTIHVTCTDCGSSYRPDKLLRRGRCDC